MASHSLTLYSSSSSFNLFSSHRLNPSANFFTLHFPCPVKRPHFDLRCSVSIEKEVPETERPFTLLTDSDGDDTQSSSSSVRARFEKMIRASQDKVCEAIEAVEGGPKFKEDVWSRPGGGGGISRVLQYGNVWEKAGVNALWFMVLCLLKLIELLKPLRLSKNQVRFRSLPPESARFCILRTLLLRLCISITVISRPMLQRMFLELRGNGGLVVGLISHLLTSSKRTSNTSIRFKNKPAINLIRPSTLGSRNGVMTTFTSSTVARGEGLEGYFLMI